MLRDMKLNSMDELIHSVIPKSILLADNINVPTGLTEYQYLRELREKAAKNKVFKNYIGLGYHDCIVPSVIKRNVFENPGWYTAYTPYQAEIAQGRMEALLNFQTMVSDLTGMELANASLLDEATAASEAMIMLHNKRPASKKQSHQFFVANDCYPQTIDVLKTRATHLGIELIVDAPENFKSNDNFFGMILQFPNCFGAVVNYKSLVENAKEKEITVVVAADLMSLALLTPPAEWGVDVVVGSTQRFGIPLGFGGPHPAFFATHDAYKRNIPGRIIGLTQDAKGGKALRMALQTREQHIKRDKATSNICTAQVLLAVMSGFYAVYHGAEGIKNIASNIHNNTALLASGLNELGYKILNNTYFDTITFDSAGKQNEVKKLAEENQINFKYWKNGNISISISECTQPEDLKSILSVFSKALNKQEVSINKLSPLQIIKGTELERTSPYLTHKIFNTHHSETEMMRYLKHLENKDISLVHSMIPLGSCTMKLNAATELEPLSWPEWSSLHPFAPSNQTQGYLEVIIELESLLKAITGLHGVSLQPNSGAQGEYAGLLVIKEYLKNSSNSERDICLIPSSAHGTNPASAVMAGFKVVVVKCDEQGNIDVADLKAKAEEHSNKLAALMITYPSTHGVYEEGVVEVTNIIHKHGGQVYMDGANMNAQVAFTNPAKIGADVCHLNLHKTFSIPHGGGGPGMGPIAVAEHLTPYLPGHVFSENKNDKNISAVSAANWSSASILLISYAYIKMMGFAGLKNATEQAILNANYIKHKIEKHYPVLYTNNKGFVAHEFIIDCRKFKTSAGIEVVDIAKRLMDYGYHAPTVSFPVPGTMMIEPTESESLDEINRFCNVLISIRKEIEAIENGKLDHENNMLKNAPHTIAEVCGDKWEYPYSRKEAAFPLDYLNEFKIWPSVKRVDDAYGDRNLMCVCPPIESYAELSEV